MAAFHGTRWQHNAALGGRIDCIHQLRFPHLPLRSCAFLSGLCFASAQAVTVVRFLAEHSASTKIAASPEHNPEPEAREFKGFYPAVIYFFAFLAEKTLVKPQNHLNH